MNELTTAAPRQTFDLSPRNFEQALTLADYLADSDMVPKQYRGKPGDCLVAMQWGMEIGLKPLQALQSIAPINGKPNLYGDAGKALLLSHGCIIEEDAAEVVKANLRASCTITRPGRPPVRRTFSQEDAKTAGLWGKEGPWRGYPWRQMAWRAFWFAARDAAADLLRGMGGFEEGVDTPPPVERHMGAADVVQPPTWPDDVFAKQMLRWTKAVADGVKTTEEILAFALGKGQITTEQRAQIEALHPPASDSAEPINDQFVADMEAAEGAVQ